MPISSIIAGAGSYLPEKVITNRDLERTVATTHEWIVERTGILERHIAADGELTSDMAAIAAQRALRAANLASVDLLIVATTTPDHTFPSTAACVQGKLGLPHLIAFDMQAVCAGFIYALATADNFIKTGMAKSALVIGADTLSRIVDWQDRSTCILFGDGAGAVVLVAEPKAKRGILSSHLHTDGSKRNLLYVDGGPGSNGKAGVIKMLGKEVFRYATQYLADCTMEALSAHKLTTSDIDWLVPHQANIRILQATAKRLGIPEEKVIVTVQNHANTSAASIPLALDVAIQDGRIKPGNLVAMQAIGGGLAWGASLIRW